MKSTIKIETLGASNGVYVTLGDHVLKTYDTWDKPLNRVIKTAERFARNWIQKYWTEGGIIESYNENNTLITRIEY